MGKGRGPSQGPEANKGNKKREEQFMAPRNTKMARRADGQGTTNANIQGGKEK